MHPGNKEDSNGHFAVTEREHLFLHLFVVEKFIFNLASHGGGDAGFFAEFIILAEVIIPENFINEFAARAAELKSAVFYGFISA